MRIQQSVAQDDLFSLVAAKTLYSSGIPQHFKFPDRIQAFSPHLYLYSMVLAFKLFGVSEVAARLPGVCSGVLAIIMVFLIMKSFSEGDKVNRLQWASLSSLLYASTPAVVQGSLILATGNTILIPVILLLYYSFAKYQQSKNFVWAVLIALTMAVALWGRVTTPPIIAFLLIFYALMSKNTFRIKLFSICAILSGALLFVLSWYIYCKVTGVPFSQPFMYALDALQNKGWGSGGLSISQTILNLIFLTLWVGVFPLLLFLTVTAKRFKYLLKDFQLCLEDIFLLSSLVLIVGYTLIGGAIFGFPRYHCSAIPLFYIFIGIALSKSKASFTDFRLKIIFIITIVAFLIQILVVGDLLYVFRYTLRSAIVLVSPLYPILKGTVFKIGFFLFTLTLLFAVCSRYLFKKSWILLLVIFSVGTNTGILFLQSTVAYHTGYNYGGEGTIEAARYVRENVPLQSVVLAPSEVIYYLKLQNSSYLPDKLWTNTDELRRRLADGNTSALVYSIATNTIQQIQTISTNEEIQALLHKYFDETKIGSYVIWIRKK